MGTGEDLVGGPSPPIASTAIGSTVCRSARRVIRRRRPRRGPCTSRSYRTPCGAAWRSRSAGTRCEQGRRASTRQRGGCGSCSSTSSSWERPRRQPLLDKGWKMLSANGHDQDSRIRTADRAGRRARPPVVGGRGVAPAGRLVAVDTAGRTQAGTVGTADGHDRQVDLHHVAHDGHQVDLVALDREGVGSVTVNWYSSWTSLTSSPPTSTRQRRRSRASATAPHRPRRCPWTGSRVQAGDDRRVGDQSVVVQVDVLRQHLERDVTLRARAAEQFGGVDEEGWPHPDSLPGQPRSWSKKPFVGSSSSTSSTSRCWPIDRR